MGFVTVETVTGDNDPEIYPTPYERYYAYCDDCGSFRLRDWTEPDDHQRLERRRRRLLQLAWLTPAPFLALVFFPDLDPWHATAAALVLLVVPLAGARAAGREIRHRGLRCTDCGATYERGGSFFEDRGSNPRQLTPEHVPPPSERPYWE